MVEETHAKLINETVALHVPAFIQELVDGFFNEFQVRRLEERSCIEPENSEDVEDVHCKGVSKPYDDQD